VPRQTADVIALVLVIVVAVVVISTTLAILYIQLVNPAQDVARAADAIGRIVSVIVAALVGYMAGRQIRNGNGH